MSFCQSIFTLFKWEKLLEQLLLMKLDMGMRI